MQNELAKTNFMAQELAKKMKLKVIYDPQKEIVISTPNVNRVGLQLTGYFEYFANERVQVIGPSEVHFLETLSQDDKQRVVGNFFKNSFPCIVFSRDLDIDEVFLQQAKQKGVAIFSSALSTSELISEVVENLKEMQEVYNEKSNNTHRSPSRPFHPIQFFLVRPQHPGNQEF